MCGAIFHAYYRYIWSVLMSYNVSCTVDGRFRAGT
jgi:hypothetical protein